MKKATAPNDLLQLAQATLLHAYCPYSHFPVAACIRTVSNDIFTGCNIENAAYPLSCCAELNAIGNMVSAGHRQIQQILILTDKASFCSPCGGCRQQIAEFSNEKTEIFLCNIAGQCTELYIQDLLPHTFKLQHLEP